jgi:anti-sigma-K factor RskA
VNERSGGMSAHDELRDDLAAYALGALDDREAERLRVHLESCEECQHQLRWLQEAVDLLPRTVEQLEPPPRLRDSLMETVRAEFRRAEGEPPRRVRARWWSGLRLALWRPSTAVAAAATLVVGVVAGYLIHEPGGGSTSTYEARAIHGSGVTGTLARDGGSGILRVQHMPALARDQVYEVWVQRDGNLEPSSLFVPRRDRSAEAAVPGHLDGAEAVLVTKEPRGGSKKPTSAPLLSVNLQ